MATHVPAGRANGRAGGLLAPELSVIPSSRRARIQVPTAPWFLVFSSPFVSWAMSVIGMAMLALAQRMPELIEDLAARSHR